MSSSKRKQVLGVPPPFKGEFSFVNKDASNIDSKDHNAAVSWHVMNRYEKWKKVEEAKKLRRTAKIPSSGSSGQTSATVRKKPLDLRRVLTMQKTSEPELTSYPPEPWHADNAEQMMFGRQDIDFAYSAATDPGVTRVSDKAGSSASHPSQEMYLSGHGQGADIPHDNLPPIVSRILSFAYGIMVPLTWPNESGKEKWAYEISQMWDDISTINNDSCYGFASLCLYATLMASATNDSDLASQACFFQAQAMAELQQRMTNESGHHQLYTLKAMLRLFSAETALDNTAKARIHLKMLRNIILAQGGVSLLDQWFKENLLSADCYFALKYETRPLFPAKEWSPGPMTQTWKARIAGLKIREDHNPKIDSIIEHANLRDVITDLREIFRIEKYIDTHLIQSNDQLMRWRQFRKLDCISRLAEHQLSVKIYPHLFALPKLQLAVCKGVALMTAMTLGSPEPLTFGLKLLQDLRPAFESMKEEIEADADDSILLETRDVTYWLLYVGSLAEMVHNVPNSDKWFTWEYNSWTNEAGLGNEAQQIEVLRKFLFSTTLIGEIQSNRARRSSEPRKGIYDACGMSWRKPMDFVDAENTMNE